MNIMAFGGTRSPKISERTGSIAVRSGVVWESFIEMILGFASRYACLGDLDKWAASRLQVACK